VELLDRYLYEVRRHLPAAQQDDIIAEISDAIQSQFEDRERQLGRQLTASEEAAIVKAFGHPKIVASRYQPAQYLIGPEIYPFYWYTLRIALAAALALELLGALIAALLKPAPLPALLNNITVMWPTIFLVLGVVTCIFVALERTGSSSSVLAKLGIDKWNPRALPRPTHGEVPRFSLLIEALANILFMLWLLNFLPLRHAVGYIMTASGGGKALAPLAFTPAWHPLVLLAFLAAALIVLQDFVLLLSPSLTKLRAGTLLTANVLMVIGACLVLQSHSLVALTQPATPAYAVAIQALNAVAFISLVVFAVAITIAAAFNVRTLLQQAPKADLNISYETRSN
jgi:hypothetical protein